MVNKIIIRKPDDWHLHLREQAMLRAVVGSSAKHFARALIMPNLKTPITSLQLAEQYHDEIISSAPIGFTPHLAMYLTNTTTPQDVVSFKNHPYIRAYKMYPRQATTNSSFGVDLDLNLDDTLSAMAEANLLLLIHGELNRSSIDVFDKERVFIRDYLPQLLQRHPKLRVVLEHISTKEAVDFINTQQGRVAATITPHHLAFTRNAIFNNGLRPHYYCLPLLQTIHDRDALVSAAISGKPWFFAGTDSAPHSDKAKESECGCAGIFNAPTALSIYADIFYQAGAMDRFENFVSVNGAHYYQLPLNQEKIQLSNQPWTAPKHLHVDETGEDVRICLGGTKLEWQVLD